jgi:serine/threonine protein kinase/Flp pilus assembly protein TadD
MIGQTLSHYEIREKLGTGGMGEVYSAEDTKLNRKVALKLLPADLAEDPERRERFEREAKAVASLNHPNIVTIYSVEEAEGLHFITMELVEGKTLTEVIPEGGMPLEEFFRVSIPLSDAINTAHQKGITHRDLKPNNVMVTNEGRVKVLDFGLAKLVEGGDAADRATQLGEDLGTGQLTEAGQIIGTVAYMSPEQAEGKLIDSRSDIFSLGVMLYEMAAGEAPFQGDTKISVITSILRDTPPTVSDINHSLPSHLGRVINRTLAKDPSRRFQTSTDLRNELEDLKAEFDTSEMRRSGMSIGPITRRKRRRNWALAAAGVVGSLMIAAFFYAMWPHDSEPGGAPGAPGVPAAFTGVRPSLAVLYFENLSNDASLEWMRTGLTDMLVTDLSQSPNIRVLATDRLYQILDEMGQLTQSINSFETVQAVAREADVGTVLLGSFAEAGGRIRISARLQDADSGEILTSESVEGQGEESIFGLVDELTRRIKRQFEMPEPMMIADIDKNLDEVSTKSVAAYRLYTEGVGFHERYQEEEAIPLLEEAVELDPNFAMALAKLSVVHGNLGDADKAKEYATRAMENLDRLSDRERFYVEGRFYSLEPQTAGQAVDAYRKVVDKYPDHTAARHNLAAELMKLDELDEAIIHYEALMKAEPKRAFPATPLQLADAYGRRGDVERGFNVLREFADKNPDNAAAHLNLANYLVWAGRPDEARAELEAAESLQPGSGQAEMLRVNLDILDEDWSSAADRARGLAESSGSLLWQFQGLVAQGLVELFRGQSGSALNVVRQIADELPEASALAAQAPLFGASIHFDLEDYPRALRAAQMAADMLEDEGDPSEALGLIALSQAAMGDEEAAEATIEQLMALTREMPQRMVRSREQVFRGRYALALEDYELAAEELERAVRMMSPRPSIEGNPHLRVWYSLGLARFEDGEEEQAVEWFQRAVDSRPHTFDPIAYVRSLYYLGRIHEELGDDAQARHFYQRFLDFWEDGDMDRDKVEEAQEFLE